MMPFIFTIEPQFLLGIVVTLTLSQKNKPSLQLFYVHFFKTKDKRLKIQG